MTKTFHVRCILLEVVYDNYCSIFPTQLLGWIEEKLPAAGKLLSELNAIVPPLLSCLEDRSGEVRKKAQVVVPLVMAKVGYDVMAKQAGKLKVSRSECVLYRDVHVFVMNTCSTV